MNKLYRFLCVPLLAALLLTGCSSYQPGTTENNIYRNEAAGFQITTPDDYICYDEDNYSKVGYYDVNKLQAAVRGAEDSWQCEYAAQSPGCEVLVCSEDNVKNQTLDEYAEALGEQMKIDILDFKVQTVDESRLGGKIFKHLRLTSGEFDVNVYIRQVDDTFVYIYHTVLHHEWLEGQEEHLLNNITGIG